MKITVTREQVWAARISVRLARRFGWDIDPLELRLARVRLPTDRWWRRW